MRKGNADQYELFYLELPPADYLKDIQDITIQDVSEPPDSDKRGLSEEQVSALARDSLNAIGEEYSIPPNEQQLFRQDDTQN